MGWRRWWLEEENPALAQMLIALSANINPLGNVTELARRHARWEYWLFWLWIPNLPATISIHLVSKFPTGDNPSQVPVIIEASLSEIVVFGLILKSRNFSFSILHSKQTHNCLKYSPKYFTKLGGRAGYKEQKPLVLFQRTCRLILGSPTNVLHLVWGVVGIFQAGWTR